ncbi:MAG: helix-turn-helix domain-containing protein [Pelotomaculum sp.]|nr:helix-turn-helix domain-containing protein [Pelotomaculum sp.]
MDNRLRQIRRAKDITQEELAKAIGVTRQTIIAIEKGQCIPCKKQGGRT